MVHGFPTLESVEASVRSRGFFSALWLEFSGFYDIRIPFQPSKYSTIPILLRFYITTHTPTSHKKQPYSDSSVTTICFHGLNHSLLKPDSRFYITWSVGIKNMTANLLMYGSLLAMCNFESEPNDMFILFSYFFGSFIISYCQIPSKFFL